MKLFGIILGVFLLGFGIYLTIQGWSFAAEGRLLTQLYIGPFLTVMGCFRILRSLSLVPLGLVIRYSFLGAAILAGMGDRALAKSAYPNASSSSLTSTQ